MTYKCRLTTSTTDFREEIILHYKPKGKLLSKSVYIYFKGWGEKVEVSFIDMVKELNSMNDKSFFELMQLAIMKKEKYNLEKSEKENDFNNEVKKLNNRGKFTIEI